MTQTVVLGPAPCICGAPVYYVRELLGWAEPTGRKAVPWQRHTCKRGERCGSLMRSDDRCARRLGHEGGHRSRWAMDNALIARRAA